MGSTAYRLFEGHENKVPITRTLRMSSQTFNNDLCNVTVVVDKPLKNAQRARTLQNLWNNGPAASRPRNTTQDPVYTRLSSVRAIKTHVAVNTKSAQ